MGQLHARLLRQNPGAEFVGIADVDGSRSQTLAKHCRTQAFTQATELLDRIDAVILAVPTSSHFAIGKIFLQEGVTV